MDKRDRRRLNDMLEHAREAHERIEGLTFDAYVESRELQLISERLLEIIGEAATYVSDDVRDAIDLDWRGIRALRNVISHQYAVVDHEAIYGILVNRVPELIETLEDLLAE